MKKIKIIKANGDQDYFSEEKFLNSIIKSGISQEIAKGILKEIEGELKEGTTTGEIYKKAFSRLKKEHRPAAARYSLKQALMELGPTGYPFEQIVGRILEREGYKVSFPESVQGRCIRHEVDVVAEKGKEKIMAEVKFHNQAGFRTDAKTAMYVRGRFEDLSFVKENGFNRGWLVTNTKFSKDAIDYANCVGITAIGWDHPRERGIEEMLIESKLLPITVLTTLNREEKRKLLEAEIVVCSDLKIKEREVKMIIGEKKFISALKETEEIENKNNSAA
ncbi:MAG: restriction endonuclease [Candidatus Pacebacteria bacterium]|nr:restriction endonuclease [Candidatus Paceibacterota bacterium]